MGYLGNLSAWTNYNYKYSPPEVKIIHEKYTQLDGADKLETCLFVYIRSFHFIQKSLAKNECKF